MFSTTWKTMHILRKKLIKGGKIIMNKIWVFVFVTFLLTGCASLLQTEQLQSVIRKPVNYCKLNRAYHKVATLEDAPLYDDSKCYTDGFHQLNIRDHL